MGADHFQTEAMEIRFEKVVSARNSDWSVREKIELNIFKSIPRDRLPVLGGFLQFSTVFVGNKLS